MGKDAKRGPVPLATTCHRLLKHGAIGALAKGLALDLSKRARGHMFEVCPEVLECILAALASIQQSKRQAERAHVSPQPPRSVRFKRGVQVVSRLAAGHVQGR